MKLKKEHKIAIGVIVLAVAAYFAWQWWQNRQGSDSDDSSPTGAFGTNLNSVAPELVGGSTGPSVGPAVALPVNITLTEQVAQSPDDDDSGPDRMLAGGFGANPVHRQRNAGLQPASAMALGPNDSALNDAATGMHQEDDDTGTTFDTTDDMDSDDDNAQ